MNKKEYKENKRLEPAALSRFLRAVADEIDGSAPATEEVWSGQFKGFHRARLKLKIKPAEVSFNVKIERKAATGADPFPGAALLPEDAGSGKTSYKALKKRMKTAFKTIGESLLLEELPERATIDSFLRDSALMTAYPGRGDETYSTYKDACRRLSAAFKTSDIAALKAGYEELKRLKNECHKLHR